MLIHADVWRAVDRLAAKYGLSASGLARRAGLDPTTFNKSKRVTREGKNRWPSTESVAKILAATGASFSEFVSYVGDTGSAGVSRHIPVIDLAQAGSHAHFDGIGREAGGNSNEIPFPGFSDPNAYALKINGDSMEPVFREGDIVIVSPKAEIHRGNRVIVKTAEGAIIAKTLLRQTSTHIEFQSLNSLHEDHTLMVEHVEWLARVIWVSQ